MSVKSEADQLFATNPTTGQRLEPHIALNDELMDQTIQRANVAFQRWKKQSIAQRADVLKAVAKGLRAYKTPLAELMAKEMGKPVKEGLAEVEKAAVCSEFYAANAEVFLKPEEIDSDASSSYVCYEPLGPILGILPWNAPVWLASRFFAPALMAGNTCVVKHDPNVPGCAELIAKVFSECAPEDIFVSLPVITEKAAAAIQHNAIQAVSFTGSSRAGAVVAATAAEVIKPSVLELGGSDPCIVLSDANLQKAADVITLSRIINAGQSCIAAKRIIVVEDIYSDFIAMLKARLEKLRVGDPLLETTDIGPLAREDLRELLHRQVSDSVASGAQCQLGGELPQGEGYFYPPTLLTDVEPGMAVFEEETFGPVMVVIKASNFDHAMELANKTDYGLAAGIWSENRELTQQAIVDLQAGQVVVNGIVKTDPRLPSGGIKRSGFGRELGPHGIREFVNAKQVWIG